MKLNEIEYPLLEQELQKAFLYVCDLFPEFKIDLVDYKAVPVSVAPYGKAIAWTNPNKRIMYISTRHNFSPIEWSGREIILRGQKSLKHLNGIVRHEIFHLIQYVNGQSHEGSTHLCPSWFWNVVEWCKREHDFLFFEVDFLVSMNSKLSNKKYFSKDERAIFSDFFSTFEFNETLDGMKMYRELFLKLIAQSPTKHGNLGKVRAKQYKKCLHCHKDFMGNSRAKFCSNSCKTSACRARNRHALDLVASI
jgi:hypothetical protein